MTERVDRIDLSSCRHWRFDDHALRHSTGRYFSIVFVDDGRTEQVMIDQPEVGILGFLLAGEPRQRRWLVQFKPEPGNLPLRQWAPSVQATKSNYQRVHGGTPTPFLERFTDTRGLCVDVQASEQGDRFLNKFNRNSKRLLAEAFPVDAYDGQFGWVEADAMRTKLRESYAVNTDARSVIASGAWSLLSSEPDAAFLDGGLPGDIAEALHRSYRLPVNETAVAQARDLLVRVAAQQGPKYRRIGIDRLRQHRIEPQGIYDGGGRRVIGYFDVTLPERETARWQQPLLERDGMSECALLFCIEDGVAHFNLTAYPELGYHDRAEFGPTLQTGEGRFKHDDESFRALLSRAEVIHTLEQSDEGGRFYRNICRYSLAYGGEDRRAFSSDHACWLSAADIEHLSLQQGALTNELRTLLSVLVSYI